MMKYTRLYTDANGESRFEDVSVPLRDNGLVGRLSDKQETSTLPFRQNDPYIPVKRTDESRDMMADLGARVTYRIYPGMTHTINTDELRLASAILEKT
ncbi:MAG: hypothetical protein ACOC2H_06645 [Spirochaetota bacterium]